MILDDLMKGVLEGPRDELIDQAYGNQEGLRGVGRFKARHRHLPWQSDARTLDRIIAPVNGGELSCCRDFFYSLNMSLELTA